MVFFAFLGLKPWEGVSVSKQVYITNFTKGS